MALQSCATVEDFERLLQTTAETGRRTKANFGVIDAEGGAAIFETSHRAYTKFDAADEDVAPDGYIVRANFAMTGGGSAGEIRYGRGCALCEDAMARGGLDYRFLVREFCRDLADEAGQPYSIPVSDTILGFPPGTLNAVNTINRYSTTSAMIFHGVAPRENPALTTFWVLLGEPIFTAAVPCWVGASVAPELDGEPTSPLCSAVLEIVEAEYQRDGRRRALLNTEHLQDIWSVLFSTEDEVFDRTDRVLAQWRKRAPSRRVMTGVHEALAAEAMAAVLKVREMVVPSRGQKRLEPAGRDR